MGIRRRSEGVGGAVSGGVGPETVDVQALPSLLEYLTSVLFEDGSERETSTLLVFTEDGRWKVALNDRQEGRSLWVSGSSFFGALLALEEQLCTGEGDWRVNRARKK